MSGKPLVLILILIGLCGAFWNYSNTANSSSPKRSASDIRSNNEELGGRSISDATDLPSDNQGPGDWTIICAHRFLAIVLGFVAFFLMLEFGGGGVLFYILCGLAAIGSVAYFEKDTAEQGKPITELIATGFLLSFVVVVAIPAIYPFRFF